MPLRSVALDELTIEDERSLAAVGLYGQLKRVLQRSKHRFLIPTGGSPVSWDRVVFLNLTFWNGDEGADVLCDDHVPADVIAHIAWHHIVGRHLPAKGRGTLLFAESIASAFDLYLVGRLLVTAPESDFVTTQVPIMGECALEAGLAEADFTSLIEAVSRDPERAFEDMRALLFDATTALLACRNAEEADGALTRFVSHRFEPLLHHYQLSNWILYARAYGTSDPEADEVVRRLDATLREAPDALAWLAEHWVAADENS